MPKSANFLIDRYLQAIGTGATSGEGDQFWPLLPSQVTPYFEVEQALEIFDILNSAKKTHSTKQIASLFPYPGILRNFMRNCGLIGLKAAHILGIRSVPVERRTEYFQHLTDILRHIVSSDPFCLDGKNFILDTNELEKIFGSEWVKIHDQNRRDANSVHVTLFSWIWATYYNMFDSAGLEPHGPYPVPTTFAQNATLIIRDYHGAYCPEVWPLAKKLPFQTIRLFYIYEDLPLHINFENQIMSDGALGAHLSYFRAEVDDHAVSDFTQLEQLILSTESAVSEQTKYVNSLSNFDKIRQGAKISYFSLKSFFDYFKIPWWKPAMIDANIKKFGEQFLSKFSNSSTYSQDYARIVTDPRNDLLGEEALAHVQNRRNF